MIRKGDTVTIPAGTTIRRCPKRRFVGSRVTSLARRARTVEVVDVSPSYGPNHPAEVFWRGTGGYLYAAPLDEAQR